MCATKKNLVTCSIVTSGVITPMNQVSKTRGLVHSTYLAGPLQNSIFLQDVSIIEHLEDDGRFRQQLLLILLYQLLKSYQQDLLSFAIVHYKLQIINTT